MQTDNNEAEASLFGSVIIIIQGQQGTLLLRQ